jgi:hypothetical protein
VRHSPLSKRPISSDWKHKSPSAAATKQAIILLLTPLTHSELESEKNTKTKNKETADTHIMWADQVEEGSYEIDHFPPLHLPLRTEEEKTPDEITFDKDEHIAAMTFALYVNVYNRLSKYYEDGLTNPQKHVAVSNADTDRSKSQVPLQLFFENRMLAMHVCEEQMHLVQRHQENKDIYNHGKSWELLFYMFMHQHQLFAEQHM